MSRVRCPKCDSTQKIGNDYDRTTIPCLGCGHKIRVASSLVSDEVKSKRRKPRAIPALYLWLPVLIAAPLTLLLIAVSFRSEGVGTVTLFLGLTLFVSAFIWGVFMAVNDGAHINWDYLDSMGPVRWVLISFFFALYILGYFIYLGFTQIQYALRRPTAYLPLFILQGVGVLTLCCMPFASMSREGKEFRRRMAEDQEKQDEQKRYKEEFKAKNGGGGPVKNTGDAALDKTLADAESSDASKSTAALGKLAAMAPNEHRGIVAQRLANLAKQTYGNTRVDAIVALEKWATKNEVPIMLELLLGVSDREERCLLRAFGKLRDERTVKPVADLLNMTQLSYDVKTTLIEMGPMVEKTVLPMLNDGNRSVQDLAMDILQAVGTKESLRALEAIASAQFNPRAPAANRAIAAIKSRAQIK